MSAAASCIYLGRVMHARLRPFVQRFVYRVFSLYLDLDELPALDRRLRLFSHNRWNLFAFRDQDHGPRDGSPLRPWIEEQLATAGIDLGGGAVRLLCFPRLLGYVFNPLSIWFCYHCSGRLAAVLYEVSNTFGQRHGYLLPLSREHRSGEAIAQRCEKGFYVSPFIGMAASYDFRLFEPDQDLSISIRQSVPEGPQLVARHDGARAPLSDSVLLKAFLAHPLMSIKVVAGIHWEALKLWLRGARFHARPPAPENPITVVPPMAKVAAK